MRTTQREEKYTVIGIFSIIVDLSSPPNLSLIATTTVLLRSKRRLET
ncbi:MAG: hypothetical protein QXL96_11400 [Ignisphaera sp.]